MKKKKVRPENPIRKLCLILEREFRKELKRKGVVKRGGVVPVLAAICNETIYVIYDRVIYRMQIGSDDDIFHFEIMEGQQQPDDPFLVWVRFPIPDDYINKGGAIPSDYYDPRAG